MSTFREQAQELVSKMTFGEKMEQMRYDAPAIPRLGVPAYNWWNECLHGVARSGAATVFPQAIAMAAAFDRPMLYETAQAISDEARAKYNEYKTFGDTQIYQGLTYWSPNINIFRDPRWGRGHETYGEDPYLTATMGTAFVKGLQGEDGTYRKLDATLKHYAVHSGPEALRHEFDAKADQKDLYETYLYAFRYCVEHADPSAVMGAYNRTNGEACCASPTLLQKILREEFGFQGYVVSDCGAICDINNHHKLTANEAESAALAVKSGCDLNCGSAYVWLKTAAAAGLIDEETITEAVVRLFTARFRLGMFAKDCPYDNLSYDVVECEKHTKLNRQMAADGMVLLKNTGILPLNPAAAVAVIGPNADDRLVLLGNYNGTPSRYTTFLKGIQDASEGKVYYARGCHITNQKVGNWAEHPLREAVLAARRSDVVVMCMGLNALIEGEEGDAYNGDRSGDKADLELPNSQRELYEAVIETGKPVIFVNVSGSAMNLCRQSEECAAVIQCFYPGAEGGNALGDILYGKVNPSGRLPVTFYRSHKDLPDFEDYSMENRTYRYFKGKPLYPFGYGLSYTNFQVKSLTAERTEEGLSVSAAVANEGSLDGKFTLPLYLTRKDREGRDPLRWLVGYDKAFIRAGETLTFRIAIEEDILAMTGEDGVRSVKPGEYEILAGGFEENCMGRVKIRL
ncbi:MAG TPA: glycoside hydrolase family 3 C-terminal domain-containing protein [Candidatus Hungatella pullicola]|nr:glycoside hydrolase family 3 C-terminal domain-containing protein [Candidatus Hungatella pullicola]